MKPLRKSVKLILFALAAGLLLVLFYCCPFRLFFGVSCPGCGMTRAFLAACTADFEKAFSLHPLVPFLLPIGMYVWLSLFHGMRVPVRQQTVYLLFIFTAFILVYVVRMMNGDPVLLFDVAGQTAIFG